MIMSLLNTLKAVKDDGFDPKKDSINNGGGGLLDTGVYPMRLVSSDLSVTKNGHEQVVLTLQVVSGEYVERREMLFLAFYDTLPDFVKEKNAKILMTLAELTGVKFTESDLKDELTTADAMKRGIGKQVKMDLKVVPNKKNPEYPYRNYEFRSLEVEPANEVDIDFPF